MPHPSFYNETITKKTKANIQAMAERKARLGVIDSILEKLQQLWTVFIQISYYVKNELVVKASINQVFLLFLFECNSY